MRHIPGHGFVIDGHDTPRADVVARARQHLVDAGIHHLQADDIVSRPGMVVAAWWAGDQIGFCGPDYPGAVPVTVVNAPMPETPTAAQPGRPPSKVRTR